MSCAPERGPASALQGWGPGPQPRWGWPQQKRPAEPACRPGPAPRPGPHLLDGEVVDEVVVVLVEAAVQGHAVAVKQQVLQGAHPLQPQGPLRAVRQVGVVEEHVEAEGLGPQRHRLPHAAWRGEGVTVAGGTLPASASLSARG